MDDKMQELERLGDETGPRALRVAADLVVDAACAFEDDPIHKNRDALMQAVRCTKRRGTTTL